MEIITIYWEHHRFNEIKGFEYGLYRFNFRVRKTLTKKYKLLNEVPKEVAEIFRLPSDYFSDCYIKCKDFTSFGYTLIKSGELILNPISSDIKFNLDKIIKEYEI